MTTPDLSESSPAVNEDGYLLNPDVWDRDMAEKLARMSDVWPLTEKHWKIIEFLRWYYEQHGQGPVVYKICRATGISVKEICELFPCGMVRGAYRIAGLPWPGGCG